MLTNIPDAIKKSSRLMVLRHPNAVDVWVYRKTYLRDEDSDSANARTLGGFVSLADEDEFEYELNKIGEGKMLFLGRILGSEYALNGLDYADEDMAAYVESLDDDFVLQKQDRVIWVMAGFAKAYQVASIQSPLQMPENPLKVVHLQPLELSFDFDESEV